MADANLVHDEDQLMVFRDAIIHLHLAAYSKDD